MFFLFTIYVNVDPLSNFSQVGQAHGNEILASYEILVSYSRQCCYLYSVSEREIKLCLTLLEEETFKCFI